MRSLRLALACGAFTTSCLMAALAPSISHAANPQLPAFTDQEVSDAYIYLLGRLLVQRQQQLDFQQGMRWNQLVHRKPGAVDWPNPNLDVAYSEAWVAVDEGSCTLVSVPKISDRYYTVQFLNGWGETLANINERTFAQQPSGDFAVCLKGASVTLPTGVQRVDLPVRTARVLSRVELGADPQQAERLQQQFSMRPTGSPQLPEVPQALLFGLQQLPGVEAFDAAEVALKEPDLNPGMEALQANVHALAALASDPARRAHLDEVIRKQAFAALVKAAPTLGPGTVRNGWVRPAVSGTYGSDYLTRTLVNLGGIWANTQAEVNYFRGTVDDHGEVLDGSRSYSLTFPRDQLPSGFARYFWSITATDARTFKVLPNAQGRFLLNNQSALRYKPDGSLTLYFGPQPPAGVAEANWLPTVEGQNFRLVFRYYGAKGAVAGGDYFPPVLVRL
ncbi:DUF1214 domain-containing protein [Pseudomonas resinovorans]|uniref:DUF1214 domain-containing protein n=1 Tax=Metapseudomonas resinovorans TaxID=53412 RepID=A0ABT4Y3K7_METRE|nr:DUF1214 domain-containing protein [Pseudomonas resinovorans]MDA8483428.1 DUF1214 domain-containing protein [Pseudomonas resinovorans]